MVAGEFAVLEPHHSLVVMAVDRFVYARIEESKVKQLNLKDFDLHLNWHFSDGSIHIESEDSRVGFVESAMNIALRFLNEKNISFNDFTLTVTSELDDESGVKYGLGSSAAVVTSVVTAILTNFLPEKPTKELIFKLSSIAHVKTQRNGSGADIAASTYGGVLQYSSFQADWLLEQYYSAKSIIELINKNWTYLSIRRVDIPHNLTLCIGWTGKPASTANLVNKILDLNRTNQQQYQKFLKDSDKAVSIFLQGLEQENVSLIFKGIKLNRDCLATVGKHANVDIETSLLGKLSDLAEQFGGAGKLSGAGGGDCGIAFLPSKETAQRLMHAWNQTNIKPLNLSIHNDGASIKN